MKTKQRIIISLLSLAGATAFAATPAETLEEGVQLLQNDGDIDGAIKRFEAVLRNESNWKRQAAEARYRLAECYHGKGDLKRAASYVEALRKHYPADNRWVLKAANLLPIESNFGPAPWRDGQFYQWTVKLKNGREIGYFLAAEHIVRDGENPVWESYIVRNAGNESLSRSKYHQNSFKMIDSRWFIEGMADHQTHFSDDGVVTITESETGEAIDTHDHSNSQDAGRFLYENEQMVQLVRCLDQDIGIKQDTLLIASLNNAVPIEFNMEVTEHEDITVPAGTFPCAKIETNLKQTFYISRDDERRVVMMDLGSAKIMLLSEEAWDAQQPFEVIAEANGSAVTLPGTVLYWVVADKKEIFRVNLWPTDFAGRKGMLEVNLTSNLVEEARKGSREFVETLIKGAREKVDELKPVEDSWEEFEIDGVDAVGVEVSGRMGEVQLHGYQICAVGEKQALSLRIDFTSPDREAAKARAMEIANEFRWGD